MIRRPSFVHSKDKRGLKEQPAWPQGLPPSTPSTPTSNKAKGLHCPGIEPGLQEWESCMIPLHQQCPHNDKNVKFCQFIGQKGTQGAAGLAPRVTTIHPTSYKAKRLHCPGIEPGSQEWESCMIPLHQQCPHNDKNVKFCQFIGQKGTQGAAGLTPRVTTIHPTSYKAKGLHCPGIEPGSQEWESCMIPLHQRCL